METSNEQSVLECYNSELDSILLYFIIIAGSALA